MAQMQFWKLGTRGTQQRQAGGIFASGLGGGIPPAQSLSSEVYRARQTLRSAWHVDGYAVIDGLQGIRYIYVALQLDRGGQEIGGETLVRHRFFSDVAASN